jgi:D-glycero-D-manno-heptose 1,7-bisphosphate phosphatase
VVKLVILDRDGVINEDSDDFIKNADEWIPIEGSITAIARLYKAGFCVVVATNQSGVGRGIFGIDELETMHKKMLQLVDEAGGRIEGIFYCPHHPDDQCDCRKPKSGLIESIERSLSTSAAGAVVVGDSLRDLQPAIKMGCRPILVKTGKGQKTFKSLAETPIEELNDLEVFNNLADAANFIIDNQSI